MPAFRSPVVRAGLVAGLLLFLHAWLPNSHAYPLLWPLLGGSGALLWVARRGTGRPTAGRTLGIGAGVGALAAAAAIVAQVPTYAFLTTGAGAPLARALGAPGPLPASPLAFVAVAAAMLLAVPAGLLGSLAARPFAHPRGA